uniref:rRNA biogenesis protein RRP36 n=1 Tax=Sparus aurata TaxID=8175 RepID=A0A671V4H3_SPAAU
RWKTRSSVSSRRPPGRNTRWRASSDEDSDVEENFILLTERRGRGGGAEEEGEQHHEGEEEEELSGGDDDDDEKSLMVVKKKRWRRDQMLVKKSLMVVKRRKMETLSNMSFEDILKLQNKVGTKVYNEVAYGGDKMWCLCSGPMEISAKRPAPFLRQVVSVRKPMFRDPRFDDLSGEYKPEIFEKTFKFINDIKHREKEVRGKQLHKTKNNHKRTEKTAENQERARTSREQQRERELHFKRLQRERANQGARPFFLKNSEKKKLQLAEKYEELKKSGKLENFLSKKRKRNAGKDRRKLPKQAA